MESPLHVAYVASEMVPFIKTGGLADVSAALPKALAHLGHRVTVLLPLYRGIDKKDLSLEGSANIPLGGHARSAAFYRAQAGDIEVVFVEHAPFFDRPFPYGVASSDYPDNALRFAFFARAALEYFRSRGRRPDVFHAHDWQAGLVPVYLKTHYLDDPTLRRMPTLFTIHNLAYQGNFDPSTLAQVDLPAHLGTPEALEFFGGISYMKGGILFAEMVSTVSPEYAREIQTPAMSYGLDGVLHARGGDLVGILNGVDYEEWDPAHDERIACRYSHDDVKAKASCKADLLRTFGLAVKPDLPLIGVVSRLVSQKGFDIVVEAADDIVARDVRLIVVGTGDADVQNGLLRLAARDPKRFAVRFAYDPVLAHKVIAGADALLMPSRYEPCGLTQMYGLRYGTVPIVRATGGLVDTVQPFDAATGKGTGFRFEHAEGTALVWAIDQMLATYGNRRAWSTIVRNGMEKDFSWDRSAAAYVDVYREAARRV
jgi:starch synthase